MPFRTQHKIWCFNLLFYSLVVNRMKTIFAQQSIFETSSAIEVKILEENTLNATTQEFITAKIWGCALKQGSKTHSSLRQSNLQLQNQAALKCLVEYDYKRCAAGLAGLPDRILLNYTRIENTHKVRKKTSDFLLRVEVQQAFSFLFSVLRHSQIPECFYVKKSCFWARATVLSRYINWWCSPCRQRKGWSAIADKIKIIV